MDKQLNILLYFLRVNTASTNVTGNLIEVAADFSKLGGYHILVLVFLYIFILLIIRHTVYNYTDKL